MATSTGMPVRGCGGSSVDDDWSPVVQLSPCFPDLNPVEGRWPLLSRGVSADLVVTGPDPGPDDRARSEEDPLPHAPD